MKVLRVKKTPIFDCFLGDGWDNWTRVIWEKDHDSVKIIDGNHLNIKEKQEARLFIRKQMEV